jgi:hypothetical protein
LQVKAPHPKYDPKQSKLINIYAAVHFLVILLTSQEVVTQKEVSKPDYDMAYTGHKKC